ncbi:MAG: hypothetical protein K0M56_00925 [Kaistella sp.]|nr:hypothetical protein [Kaistella sp.]
MKYKYLLTVFAVISLFSIASCGGSENEKLKKEIINLKKKNTLTKNDSLLIFQEIRDNVQNKEVINFLDSLQRSDINKYKILIKEATSRNYQDISNIY